mgnify:CR=1 FL=1
MKILTAKELSEMTLAEVKEYEAALWRAWRAAEKVKEYKQIMESE